MHKCLFNESIGDDANNGIDSPVKTLERVKEILSAGDNHFLIPIPDGENTIYSVRLDLVKTLTPMIDDTVNDAGIRMHIMTVLTQVQREMFEHETAAYNHGFDMGVKEQQARLKNSLRALTGTLDGDTI